MTEFKDAIMQAAGTFNKDVIEKILCTIKSVNIQSRSCVCTPVSGTATPDIIDVSLMANINDGMLFIPAIDSEVIVTFVKKQISFICYVSMYSEIDDIYFIANNKIHFNDESLGGMVKVISLTTKLNNLENLVNDLITKYNTHTHSGVTTGGGVSAVPVVLETGTLTPTLQSDIENKNIIQ